MIFYFTGTGNSEYGTKAGFFAKAKTTILYPMYDLTCNTAKFYTDDKCDHCLSCVRCNIVQYGRRTVDAYRYKHPSLRKKKVVESECHC